MRQPWNRYETNTLSLCAEQRARAFSLRGTRIAAPHTKSDIMNKLEIADSLIASGRYSDAVDVIRQQLAHDPDDPSCHGALVRAYRHLAQRSAALESLETLARVAPDSDILHWVAGTNLWRLGLRDAAMPHLKEWLRREPESAAAWAENALGLSQFADPNLDGEVESAVDRAAALAPDSSQIAELCGFALIEIAAFENAEPHFRRALRIDPNSIAAQSGLAQVLEKTKRVKEATALYAGIGKRSPRHARTATENLRRISGDDVSVPMFLIFVLAAVGMWTLNDRRNDAYWWWLIGLAGTSAASVFFLYHRRRRALISDEAHEALARSKELERFTPK